MLKLEVVFLLCQEELLGMAQWQGVLLDTALFRRIRRVTAQDQCPRIRSEILLPPRHNQAHA